MRYLLIALIGILAACAGNDSEFHELESNVQEDPSNQNITELLNAYEGWLNNNPGATPERKVVLVKEYNIANEHTRYTQKADALTELILDYPDDPETIQRLVELSKTYERLQRNMAAHVLNSGLMDKYPDNELVKSEISPKLAGNGEPADTTITKLGQAMFDNESMRLNGKLGRQYIDACEAYAIVYDGVPESAELLHKAAETARSLNTVNRAIELYDWIIARYPEHKRTAQALFLKAFTYDSNLGDFENARKYYTEFLEKYPNDEFAQSAEFLLDNLGKDDEELLEILQQKSNEQQGQEGE